MVCAWIDGKVYSHCYCFINGFGSHRLPEQCSFRSSGSVDHYTYHFILLFLSIVLQFFFIILIFFLSLTSCYFLFCELNAECALRLSNGLKRADECLCLTSLFCLACLCFKRKSVTASAGFTEQIQTNEYVWQS